MSLVKATVFCLILISFDRVALLASKTHEGGRNCQFLGIDGSSSCTTSDIFRSYNRDMKPSNDTSSETSGPPDSHEAMNNREIHSKVREKRSYEFLMGLINNNSRYEVTKVDPEQTTEKPKIIPGVNASELLLELMVKIASQPEQWSRVHNLLQTIDQDLKTSRDVVTKLQRLSNESESHITDSPRSKIDNIKSPKPFYNDAINHDEVKEKKWPVFDPEEHVQFVNNNYTTTNENRTINNSEKSGSKSSKSAYPKNFTYHRVTGKPDSSSKNPRAYIAVSVIAPKQTHTGTSEEDVALENELHQLKPWSHMQNLKNMETLRSKWVIQNHQKNKKL